MESGVESTIENHNRQRQPGCLKEIQTQNEVDMTLTDYQSTRVGACSGQGANPGLTQEDQSIPKATLLAEEVTWCRSALIWRLKKTALPTAQEGSLIPNDEAEPETCCDRTKVSSPW